MTDLFWYRQRKVGASWWVTSSVEPPRSFRSFRMSARYCNKLVKRGYVNADFFG